MIVPRSSPHAARQFIRLMSSSAGKPAVLVGTPDLISNIRPAIYDGVWFTAVSRMPSGDGSSPSSLLPSTLVHPNSNTDHPYSLDEFSTTEQGVKTDPFSNDRQAWNLQYRLEKQTLDAFSHAFWTDTNSRFNAYKQFIAHSVSSSPEYKSAGPEAQEQLMDEATASFYRMWLMQEGPKQRAYTREMYRKTFNLIWLGVRGEIQKIRWRFQTIFNS